MGYDFTPRNKSAGKFYLGAFSWPILLEAFGYLFPEISQGAKFYKLTGVDERFNHASLGECDNLRVTAEEARIMARMTRNYVAVQRSLPEQEEIDVFAPCYLQPWPRKIREDFVDKFEAFAQWAEKSGGFTIG